MQLNPGYAKNAYPGLISRHASGVQEIGAIERAPEGSVATVL